MANASVEKEKTQKSQSEIANAWPCSPAASGEGAGRKLTGPERAAVLMLALGEKYGAKIWNMLDDDELRELSIVMSTLGTVEAPRSRTSCSNSSRACRRPAR